ncbi:hypothetical protein GCM10007275_21960 [Jeotgalicoccus coquinae]|jgi:hypothetical protein|uniref:Uncharacterized protein n=2 Tax=Jeotgalicoccus TaxID=227979 RepID=A0A078MCL6_9STAP|nr:MULTISPECIES: hypothetical protein [Jeotgalicoccus]MBB6424100.1 hypothetical protein [Jeotgalicoccus coquinae]GGE26547.1 hypothetical protein GCM10007275_21960 [Jeotgalicoccus coquinae]CAD2081253.1 hypothetical protein JEOCOQ751_01891 [Jeotgalicoccus coquinae]CEA03949.1 hypothetical protein BN1048_02265 [Jeotgalicoccus saudimassiliensis]
MKNKLVPAIVIGAAVGGLIALIDKGTRDSVVSNTKSIKHYASNPDDLKQRFNEPSGEPSKVEMIKDEVLFWKDTIEEIRRNNPELERAIMDAKDTFQAKREKKLN